MDYRRLDTLTPDIAARHRAAGLTKYGYDEIVAAWKDAQQARAEYSAVVRACWERLGFADLSAIDVDHLPEDRLVIARDLDREMPTLAVGGSGRRELFPVPLWQKAAARYRHETARLRRKYPDREANAA